MKRLLFFVAGCLMIACNMTEDVENQVVSKKLFHATIDDESTRTFVDEKIRLRWTEGDVISLFEGTTRNKKYKFLGETGDNAGDFENITTGFGSGNDIDRYYAIYPYSSTTKLHEDGYITYTFPAEQNYAENSFGLGANPMVAVTGGLDDFDLCFRNAAGYLRLYLYGDDATIKSIKIEGNNSEPLAGKAYITPEFGGFPTTEMDETATTSVTLNCGEGVKIGSTAESSTPFWVVLPPTTFTEGFTLTITDTNDNEFTKSFTSNVNIQRNKYISAKIEVEFSNSLNKQILYTATAKVEPNETDYWGDNVFGANIASNEWDETTGEGVIIFDGDVTSIGTDAFYDCDALQSITIPDSVTSIGEYAFENCAALKSVTIPDSVTSIGYYAFYDCDALTSVTINSEAWVDGRAFYGCDAFKSIYGKYASDDNRCLIIDGELQLFAPAGLTTYNIPESVTSIGDFAFYGCDALQSITIPNSVTSIGEYAFENCAALKSVTIPDSVTSIRWCTFQGCDALQSITIPDGVTEIVRYAFYDCDALTSVTIGNGVTEIGDEAFESCDALTSVYCKATTPPSIQYSTFASTPKLINIYVPYSSVNAYKAAKYWSNYADKIVGYNF